MAGGDQEDFEIVTLPDVGELVICTCTRVDSHGAYFQLDEYEELTKEAGYVHVSELAKTWVRQISAHIRVGQKVVAKVLRINPKLGQVDLSIRRVTDKERQSRMQELKHEQRIKGLLKAIGVQNKIDTDTKIIKPSLEKYGSVYRAFLDIHENGVQILLDMGLDKNLADLIFKETASALEPPGVTLLGNVVAMVFDSKGISILKKIFQAIEEKDETAVEVTAISAPRYRVAISAPDWKTAERKWKEIQEYLEREI
ncbi:MAG: S1 RNA-binding domain-containing protein, partial [Candidatus Hermodarchaeota archaeon]